ncbi:hypothetical protein AB5N19_08321 [Seiridium cardinale]|uniref:N-acetyltransferase domain-containing protein n=1 Tax=Seiridium cardinale TaxID=138064 RepID=A0ABR2XB80_9PEZI
MSSEIQIYSVQPEGNLISRQPTRTAVPYSSVDIVTFLTKRLPYSLPILRRLQLWPRHEGTLFITTRLPLDGPIEGTDNPQRATADSLWTMAVVDRSGYPSTEIWPLSSLELYHGSAPHEKGPQQPDVGPRSLVLPFSDDVRERAASQLMAVISQVPITNRAASGPLSNLYQNPESAGSAYCLAGNVHTTIAALLAREDGVILRGSPPYGKYIFGVSAAEGAPGLTAPDGCSDGLPRGLVWSSIGPDDYADVRAANKIVRSDATIAHLRSAAVREVAPRPGGRRGRAVAFAFASGDGSVRTLHVDPEHRRQGLATAVVQRLLRTGAFEPPESGPLAATGEVTRQMEPTTLAFTSIEGSNTGSIRTFKAVGGKWYWDVYWLWLDLDRVVERARQ